MNAKLWNGLVPTAHGGDIDIWEANGLALAKDMVDAGFWSEEEGRTFTALSAQTGRLDT